MLYHPNSKAFPSLFICFLTIIFNGHPSSQLCPSFPFSSAPSSSSSPLQLHSPPLHQTLHALLRNRQVLFSLVKAFSLALYTFFLIIHLSSLIGRNRFRIRLSAVNGGLNEDNLMQKQTSNSDKFPSEKHVTDPFLIKLAIGLGIAVAFTLLSILVKPSSPASQGPSFALQYLPDAAPSPSHHLGFSFQVFGYRVLLPQYPPGYFFCLFYFFS